MKNFKTYPVLGLVMSLVIGGGAIFAADKYLSMDPSNNIQHIGAIKLISEDPNDNEAAWLESVGNGLLNIITNNFVITQSGSLSNKIEGGAQHSSILGGISNIIKGGSHNTILGGSGNINGGNYNTILGGKDNKISDGSQYSTILGGRKNEINGKSSVIAGGYGNSVNGDYSTVVGYNSHVTGDYSVALGLNSKVNADNSFLWTDGRNSDETLTTDNVFVVMSEYGMAVNTDTPNNYAKLTIGGPLIVYEDTLSDGLECNDDTKGVLRVVTGDNNQKCFCSCNGQDWSSMYYSIGTCESKCNAKLKPECGNKVEKICEGSNTVYYSGSCNMGEVIRGTGAYFVDVDNNIHWTCQTRDGKTEACSGSIPDGEECITSGTGDCSSKYTLPNNAEWLKRDFECTYSEGECQPDVTLNFKYDPNGNDVRPCRYKCAQGYTGKVDDDGKLIVHEDGRVECINEMPGKCSPLSDEDHTERVNGGTYTIKFDENTGKWESKNVQNEYNPTGKDKNGNEVECAYKCKEGYDWTGYYQNGEKVMGCINTMTRDCPTNLSDGSALPDGGIRLKTGYTLEYKSINEGTAYGWVPFPSPELEYDPKGEAYCPWTCNESQGYTGSFENGTWKCKQVEYKCEGEPTPPKVGYKFGDKKYGHGYTTTKWTYTGFNKLDPCRYTCDTSAHFVAKKVSTGTICVCDEANGYVLEGKQCKLKINECAKRGNIAPTMSGYIFGDIKYIHGYTPTTWTYTGVALNLSGTAVVYTGNAVTYTGSSALEPCTYTCDEENGYEKVGNTCQLKVKECTTGIGNIKPTMSGYIFGDIKYTYGYNPTSWTYKGVALNLSGTAVAYTGSAVTYTGSSILEPCTYTCDSENGYSWNSTTKKCELGQYECKGTKPEGSCYILGPSKYNYGYTPANWRIVTGSTTLKACEYTCAMGCMKDGGKCVECKYTVVYDTNGGKYLTGLAQSQIVKWGTGVQLALAPTKGDDTFVGWRNSLDNKLYNPATLYTGASLLCNQTITMTAEWSHCKNDLVVNPNGGKVKFNGTEIKSQKNEIRDCGRTITLSVTGRENVQTGSYTIIFDENGGFSEYRSVDTVFRKGTSYRFNGWTDVGTCGTISDGKYKYPVVDATKCTKTAKWGTGDKIDYVDPIKLPNVTKPCYEFNGWYTQQTGGRYVGTGGGSYTPKSDGETLYAHWTQRFYTVEYDANGGGPKPSSQTVECGTWIKLADSPKKDYCNFKSWVDQYDKRSYLTGTNYMVLRDTKMKADRGLCEREWNCTGKPINSYWVNSKFTQVLTGSMWTPSPLAMNATYSSDPNVPCSFLCDSDCKWMEKLKECTKIAYSCGKPYKCVDDEDDNKVVDGTNTGFDNNKYTRKCGITNCWDCGTGYSKGDGGICVPDECPAPTITNVIGENVYFDLNGATANTVIMYISELRSNWTNNSQNAGSIQSPRILTANHPARGYVKLKTACSNGVYSDDSNIVEFGRPIRNCCSNIPSNSVSYIFGTTDMQPLCQPVDINTNGLNNLSNNTSVDDGDVYAGFGFLKDGKMCVYKDLRNNLVSCDNYNGKKVNLCCQEKKGDQYVESCTSGITITDCESNNNETNTKLKTNGDIGFGNKIIGFKCKPGCEFVQNGSTCECVCPDPEPVDGKCDYNKGKAACETGTLENGKKILNGYQWKCAGKNGGSTASCKVEWKCSSDVEDPSGRCELTPECFPAYGYNRILFEYQTKSECENQGKYYMKNRTTRCQKSMDDPQCSLNCAVWIGWQEHQDLRCLINNGEYTSDSTPCERIQKPSCFQEEACQCPDGSKHPLNDVPRKYCVKTCFVAGTKVTMADGSQKNIEDVKIGEKLLSESGINTVLGYYRPKLGNRHLWSINGGGYFVSDEHPFKTTQGWKSFNPEMTKMEVDLDVTELKVGDILITADGYEKIETLDYIDSDYDTQLYNFVLDGDHTYFADGYLVHNKQAIYEMELGSDPGSLGTCPKGTRMAIAGTNVCCPGNSLYYGYDGYCAQLVSGRGEGCGVCPKNGACGYGLNGDICISYSETESYSCASVVSTCKNGVRDPKPNKYSACKTISQNNNDNNNQYAGGGCFLAGTPVITSEGYKNIEDIQIGDMVLSYDTVTLSTGYNKVTQRLVHEDNDEELYELTIDGNVLKVTSLHLFFVVNDDTDGYQCKVLFRLVPAYGLKVGDKLLMDDGKQVIIEGIEHYNHYGKVYNLEVENLHNYFVGEGYLVHNEKADQQRDKQLRDQDLLPGDDANERNGGITTEIYNIIKNPTRD